MIIPGLLSVTFRALKVTEIAEMAARSGLRTIEWGADVHVPPGDWHAAERARQASDTCGLAIGGYGSYHRAGHDPLSAFAPVLETASILGAPSIRVWAGVEGSAEASDERRAKVSDDLGALTKAAAAEDIAIALEFHEGTLTDSVDSTLRLLSASPDLRTHWQPPNGIDDGDALDGLRAVSGRLAALHVFSWWPGHERQPLSYRLALWSTVFAEVAGLPRDHAAMLEFVADDDPANLIADAATLLALIEATAR